MDTWGVLGLSVVLKGLLGTPRDSLGRLGDSSGLLGSLRESCRVFSRTPGDSGRPIGSSRDSSGVLGILGDSSGLTGAL